MFIFSPATRRVGCYTLFLIYLSLCSCTTSVESRYIRLDELIANYAGVKEARHYYFNSRDTKIHEIDSLSNLVEKGRESSKAMSNLLRLEIAQRQEWLTQNGDFMNSTLFQGSLDQINDFVQRYAQEQGYDMVFGASSIGNIMYGDASLDITEEVLNALNKDYLGE